MEETDIDQHVALLNEQRRRLLERRLQDQQLLTSGAGPMSLPIPSVFGGMQTQSEGSENEKEIQKEVIGTVLQGGGIISATIKLVTLGLGLVFTLIFDMVLFVWQIRQLFQGAKYRGVLSGLNILDKQAIGYKIFIIMKVVAMVMMILVMFTMMALFILALLTPFLFADYIFSSMVGFF